MPKGWFGEKPQWFKDMVSRRQKGKVVSHESRQKMSDAHWSKRGLTPWNKGLTKEDPRVANYAKHLSLSLKGHIPWNVGKKDVYSKETRQKISETLKQTYRKKGHPSTGSHFPDEVKQKIGASQKKRLNNPEARKVLRINAVKRLGSYPRRDTLPERLLQSALRDKHLAFETDYPILDISRADVAFPNLKIAIYVDGCFWHYCAECGFGHGREDDRRKTTSLQSCGWLVLRFWEHKIKKDLASVIMEILDAIEVKVSEVSVVAR